ncbi:MAG: lipid-A-disaccharide synthase N-terminal domain-containing protein [Planctomycetes bacterium]|nr:lipid-A-disaccharide synthase N-terminal domain-containing protein [Planctomycetota bacterium]
MRWVKVENPWELGVVLFGLTAQATFLGRWIVQWWASEKRGESHVPELFWWLSLAGATMLMIYYVLRGEPVGIIGQSVGWIVYSRNLYLIKAKHRRQSEPPTPTARTGKTQDAPGSDGGSPSA